MLESVGRKLVGLCGYARSGKDTAAEVLIERGWNRVAFADALKEDLYHLLVRRAGGFYLDSNDAITRCLYGAQKSVGRPLMVEYGKLMRALYPGCWIDSLAQRLATPPYAEKPAVVTDVRYKDEVDWITGQGGIIIRIVRPGVKAANDEELRSLSELKPNYEVHNDSKVENLHAAIEAIIMERYGENKNEH